VRFRRGLLRRISFSANSVSAIRSQVPRPWTPSVALLTYSTGAEVNCGLIDSKSKNALTYNCQLTPMLFLMAQVIYQIS
jgi:hypothetical protein